MNPLKSIFLYIFILIVPSLAVSQININVRDHGALGDGVTDDTEAIQNAINEAKLQGLGVFIPSGTYIIRSIEIKTNIKGTGQAVLKKAKAKSLEKYVFCNVKSQKNLRIQNITFDGAAQVDPNNVLVSGSIPLFIFNSENIEIEKCRFLNSVMSGLRVEKSSRICITNCISKGSVGSLGDGYYIAGSSFVEVKNCVAQDYNRIGFVTEKYSHSILFKNCKAINGFNASILSGGTEYNAGFWYENSANITTLNCTSEDNTHLGFVAVTGRGLTTVIDSSHSTFYFENCKSLNNPIGFQLSSSGFPVIAKVIDCRAENVSRGYIARARTVSDVYDFKNCRASMAEFNNKSSNNMGFMWESSIPESADVIPSFSFTDCYIKYNKNTREEQLLSDKNNNGDISTYEGGAARINVTNVRNSIKAGKVIIKARRGKPIYRIDRTDAHPLFLKGKSVNN